MFFEVKWTFFWAFSFITVFFTINSFFFKTIFFFSLLLNKQMLEFTYNSCLSLFNLEVSIYFYYLFILIWIGCPILIFISVLPGLFFFEYRRILKKFLGASVIYLIYVNHWSKLVETFLIYSNSNSSTMIILFNPTINDFVYTKMFLRFLISNLIIFCWILAKLRFLTILGFIFHKSWIIFIFIFEIHKILIKFHVK